MALKGSLKENNYLSLLLILIGLFLTFEIFFSSLGIIFVRPLFPGIDTEALQQLLFEPSIKDLESKELVFALKVLQITSAVGRFIIAALVFSWLTAGNPVSNLHLHKRASIYPLFLMLFALASVIPVVGWVGELNESIQFPEAFSGWESKMRDLEERALRITNAFLASPDILDFLINIFIIGVIAAVGEELLFRGAMQNIIINWTKNIHVGIWISAILFSFIHLQFYGFFPRILMGAMFGYMVVWSGSLWYPIIAHMIFNSVQISIQYYFSLKNINTEPSFETDVWIFISIIPLIGFMWIFKRDLRIDSAKENEKVIV